MNYIAASLNIIIFVITIYLCFKFNAKKYGFFYSFVVAFLVSGILCDLPGALFYLSDAQQLSEMLRKTIILFFVLPEAVAALGAVFPYLHIVPVFMTLLMIGTQSGRIGKKQVIFAVLLNIVYLLLAYENYKSWCAAFSR